MMRLLILSVLLFVSCERLVPQGEENLQEYDEFNTEYIAYSFDFPVGKPDAHGYYNAQKFNEYNHLGDDWNGTGGGNTDLGDPIYSIADGYVKFARDIGGGWGGVVRVNHKLPDGTMVESLYAHCQRIDVSPGTYIRKGEQLGTIGNVNGIYYAHLHLEIRTDPNMDIGGGYSSDTTGYTDPTDFINQHRNLQ